MQDLSGEISDVVSRLCYQKVIRKYKCEAIPGCLLGFIWNELHFRNDRHTCDPDLEAGRHRILTKV